MHVDDMIGWEDNVRSSKVFKQNTIKNFDEVDFKVNNSKELERKNGHSQMETDKTYAKQYLSKEDTKSAILALSPKQPRERYCNMKQQSST